MKIKPVLTLEIDKSKKQMWNFFLAILAFTFLLYGNSINNGYAFDDNYVTVTTPEKPNNQRIEKGIRGIPALFKSRYIESKEQSFDYRPIPLITFAIEYQFFGSNPHISHFINLLLYALTGMFLFSILAKLFKAYSIVFPLLVTFLFLAHPIHTEVVNNLKSRDELLSFLFGLCAVYFSLKTNATKKLQSVLVTMLFLLVALLCKKTAVLFIILIPISMYFFTSIKLKKIVVPALIFFSVFFIFNLFKRSMLPDLAEVREYAFFENPLYYESDFLKRIPLAFYSVGYYIRLLIFPYPLSCYYGYNAIPMAGWGSPLVWLSAIFHITIGIYALIKLPQRNILSFIIIIYLLGVIPFANIITPVVGIIGERFIYFSSSGFCMAAAYFLLTVFKIDFKNVAVKLTGLKPMFKKVLVVTFFIFSVVTIARNNKWKDMLTLCRNDVTHFKDSYILNYFTANTLYEQLPGTPQGYKKDLIIAEAQGYFKQAAQLLKTGLEQYKTDYYTLSSLGTIYINYLDDVEAGMPYFKKSLEIKPDYEVALYNIVFCYEKKNMPDTAIVLYEKMIAGGTKYMPVYFRLHELYLLKKAFTKAIEFDKKVLIQNPDEIKLYINIGNAYMLNKDTLSGLKYFEEAAAKAPADYNLLRNVAGVFEATGNKSKSAEYEKKASLLQK